MESCVGDDQDRGFERGRWHFPVMNGRQNKESGVDSSDGEMIPRIRYRPAPSHGYDDFRNCLSFHHDGK